MHNKTGQRRNCSNKRQYKYRFINSKTVQQKTTQLQQRHLVQQRYSTAITYSTVTIEHSSIVEGRHRIETSTAGGWCCIMASQPKKGLARCKIKRTKSPTLQQYKGISHQQKNNVTQIKRQVRNNTVDQQKNTDTAIKHKQYSTIATQHRYSNKT